MGCDVVDEHEAFCCSDYAVAEIERLIRCYVGREVFEFNFMEFAVYVDVFEVAVPAGVVEVWEEVIAVLWVLE